MKIIFLDIDGVVNCKYTRQRHRGYIGIDPYMAFLVGRIQIATGAELVISSSWRHSEPGLREIAKQVGPYIGITPDLRGKSRGEEIEAWLLKHLNDTKVESYIILDDDSDMLVEQLPHFIHTSWEIGLTEELAEKAINLLGKVEANVV